MALSGNRVICPGEVGVFYCTVEGGTGLEWEVDGEKKGFDGFDRPCTLSEACEPDCTTSNFAGNNFVIYLTSVRLVQQNQGDRSSLLVYTPEPDTIASVNITCKEGTMTQKTMVFVVCKSFL